MDVQTGRLFVMGDIHGAHKALRQCLQRAGFDYAQDTLIQLGDIVDGTEEVYECVEELLKIKNLIAIKGNHDVWFNEFLHTGEHPRVWNHGGLATVVSYLQHVKPDGTYSTTMDGFQTSLIPDDLPLSHRQFFNRQRLYYIDDKQRLFVHAGYDPKQNFYGQAEENYYFDRSLWLDSLAAHDQQYPGGQQGEEQPFAEIFIGHTATTKWGIDYPMTAFHITNLDTGARHMGRLSIMEVDSKSYWQSDPLPALYGEEVVRK
ncbi:metallophosphoesterase [Sphingobacterium oryzagri]|uniref:Metallophosphoesterase n=1 Tax=Sphingobacterium oryzagri TaxID=3025669 RepID=A0ABY7WM96_9SPHI|nr:metallophosphoesterase [Sphingobacterium sp. KACC 22765]WDF70726.1 metallophosphoesterase [Sphingobacterium sp. KACC 22765]